MADRETGKTLNGSLSVDQYRAIASFRHQLRRFLAFSEAAAAQVGLPGQQHQALLAVAGCGNDALPTVGFIAEQLVIAPHSAAELVGRMVAANLLAKTPSPTDRRRQELALTPQAAAILAALTVTHLAELAKLRTMLADMAEPG